MGNAELYATVLKRSPSARDVQAMSAPASRAAFSVTISRTGPRSNADWLIVFSTSEIAVCRSSASFVSLKRRAFSIAMTACRAKVSTRRISWSLNGRTSPRFIAKLPMTRSSRSIGTTSDVR